MKNIFFAYPSFSVLRRSISCFTFVLFLSVLSVFGCSAQKLQEQKKLSITTVSGKTVYVSAEIARTSDEQEHGFMERKSIPDGTGMLFVFKRDQILHFWMKNTPAALSIAYIDSKGRIRDIFDMTPFSVATISSTVSVRYALEVPMGWFDRAGIKKGDSLILDF